MRYNVDNKFDGDTMSYTAVYSQNARDEVKNFLRTRQAYIGADGNFKTNMSISPIELVLLNLTGGR